MLVLDTQVAYNNMHIQYMNSSVWYNHNSGIIVDLIVKESVLKHEALNTRLSNNNLLGLRIVLHGMCSVSNLFST